MYICICVFIYACINMYITVEKSFQCLEACSEHKFVFCLFGCADCAIVPFSNDRFVFVFVFELYFIIIEKKDEEMRMREEWSVKMIQINK